MSEGKNNAPTHYTLGAIRELDGWAMPTMIVEALKDRLKLKHSRIEIVVGDSEANLHFPLDKLRP